MNYDESLKWCKNVGTSFLLQSTRLTDRQTGGQTDRKALEILCIALVAR